MRRTLTALALATTLMLTACGGTGDGDGRAEASPRPETSTSAPATDDAGPAADGPAEPETGCPDDADACATFDDLDDWPEDNTADLFAGYDRYLGGTYRLLARTDKRVRAGTPFATTDHSNESSVVVDADFAVHLDSPATSEAGIGCWRRPDSPTEFIFLVSRDTVRIVLQTEDGQQVDLAYAPTDDALLGNSAVNHLRAECTQSTGDSGAEAHLALTLNGQRLISVEYPKTVQQHAWEVGPGIGLYVSGSGADVFFDNVAVTGTCETYC